MRNQLSVSVMLAGILTVAALQIASAQVLELPVRMRMSAVNMSNNLTGANGILEITIEKWSTPEERKQLLGTVVEKGQPALLSALQDQSVKGRIRIPGWTGADPNNYRTGWNLRYAWHEALPNGGERVVLAVDRYMSFLEIRNQPKSVDYPFTLVQLHLNKDGKNEGKLAAFTMITFDKKKQALEIENYGTEPVRLSNFIIEKK
ncbi:MAG TPA: hypothetical protein VFV95_16935 [Vicinamibacterales bacterium]|nr:hypothetical protein [Vicinamibacterales bacterium]